jgi:hypothetical protein
MKGLMRQYQPALLLFGKPPEYKVQVEPLIAAVYFVANNRMPKPRKVDAYLVLPACVRDDAQQCKWPQPAGIASRPGRLPGICIVDYPVETLQNGVLAPARGAIRTHAIFYGDRT